MTASHTERKYLRNETSYWRMSRYFNYEGFPTFSKLDENFGPQVLRFIGQGPATLCMFSHFLYSPNA